MYVITIKVIVPLLPIHNHLMIIWLPSLKNYQQKMNIMNLNTQKYIIKVIKKIQVRELKFKRNGRKQIYGVLE